MEKLNTDYFRQMIREGLILMNDDRQTPDSYKGNDSVFAFIVGLLIGIATGIMVGWGLKCLIP